MTVEEIIKTKHTNDAEQLDFVFCNNRHIVVTAPAGCGKTTAMISKIAWELSKGHIPANKKILAMTFSVNAAMKIKDAVKDLLPEFGTDSLHWISQVDVANYHNFALRLLYKHGYILSPDLIDLSNFKVISDQALRTYHFLTESELQKLEIFDGAVKRCDWNLLSSRLEEYWDVSCRKLFPNHIITYNGILISAIKLLDIQEISHFYQEYYKLILVDEFQDTNPLGYLLIVKMIGNNSSIFLGDDLQKIYGFLGAVNEIFKLVTQQYDSVEFKFSNNYRFQNNARMKALDKFIRDCTENYKNSALKAEMLINEFQSDQAEDNFIVDGVTEILNHHDSSVAILVRAGWQGISIASMLEQKEIPFFNALYSETDIEYLNFYRIALEEFYKNNSGKALKKNLQNWLKTIKLRETEVYTDISKKFVFNSLFKLVEILVDESQKWGLNSTERFENICFILENNGLKHMMEHLQEPVILTTIHASKGLEWDYVIIPKLNSYAFPSSKFVCKPCKDNYSCDEGYTYCKTKFTEAMREKMIEELNVFYVAITRARKDVFMTVNVGKNNWGYAKRTNCLVNLDGISKLSYEWKTVV